MFNCNGSIVSNINQGKEDLIRALHTNFCIHETIRINKNQILLLEEHYFRIISTLRRYRFKIPMNYTMDFFQAELQKLIQTQKNLENAVFILQFIKLNSETQFIISLRATEPLESRNTPFKIDLYKEATISSSNLSNLTPTNWGIRIMAKRYAEENGLEDVILLNENKNLVESLEGSIYLLQGTKLLTPKLEEGCQNYTIRNAFNKWLERKQTLYSVLESNLNPFELQKSEEILILSIEIGLRSVSNYRKTSYSQIKCDEIFRALNNDLFN
tara:strand:+ start:536 stop:1348 length:813 start_codon:yes stop_codon:yes gene_type:complete